MGGHLCRVMHPLRFATLAFLAAFLAPLALHAAWWLSTDAAVAWNQADWSSARLLPPARAKPEAMVHVYAARTGRWKGIFAHHSWIVVKESGAGTYTRYDKVAWGQPVKTNNWAPDARWYGHRPVLVGAVEGPAAEALIPKIRAAVARYPYKRSGDYSVWPGPNSNSFVAYVLGAIPEAALPCRRRPSARTGGSAQASSASRRAAPASSSRWPACSASPSAGSRAWRSTYWASSPA